MTSEENTFLSLTCLFKMVTLNKHLTKALTRSHYYETFYGRNLRIFTFI